MASDLHSRPLITLYDIYRLMFHWQVAPGVAKHVFAVNLECWGRLRASKLKLSASNFSLYWILQFGEFRTETHPIHSNVSHIISNQILVFSVAQNNSFNHFPPDAICNSFAVHYTVGCMRAFYSIIYALYVEQMKGKIKYIVIWTLLIVESTKWVEKTTWRTEALFLNTWMNTLFVLIF